MLPERVNETIQNEAKKQKGRFLRILLGTLGGSLLGNILAGKGINRAGEIALANSDGEETKLKRQSRGILRVGYGNKKGWKATTIRQGHKNKQNGFLMPPHSLTNFEIQKYYQNEYRLNSVYSRDNLPRIRDGECVINLDEYSDIETHRIALYVQNNNVNYFDGFGLEHIPEEIKTFIGHKNIKTNIFRIQAYDAIMCEYFVLGWLILCLQ